MIVGSSQLTLLFDSVLSQAILLFLAELPGISIQIVSFAPKIEDSVGQEALKDSHLLQKNEAIYYEGHRSLGKSVYYVGNSLYSAKATHQIRKMPHQLFFPSLFHKYYFIICVVEEDQNESGPSPGLIDGLIDSGLYIRYYFELKIN